MYATDYSVIETPFKKLDNSVLQLSGPHKRWLKTGCGSLTKWVWCPYIKPTNKHTHTLLRQLLTATIAIFFSLCTFYFRCQDLKYSERHKNSSSLDGDIWWEKYILMDIKLKQPTVTTAVHISLRLTFLAHFIYMCICFQYLPSHQP